MRLVLGALQLLGEGMGVNSFVVRTSNILFLDVAHFVFYNPSHDYYIFVSSYLNFRCLAFDNLRAKTALTVVCKFVNCFC